MNTSVDQLREQLKALADHYAQELPDKLAEIEQAFQGALRNGWQSDDADQLRRKLHSMAGAAGTFGFEAVGKSAREVEQQVLAAMENAVKIDTRFEQQLNGKLSGLISIGEQALQSGIEIVAPEVNRLKPVDANRLFIYISANQTAVPSLQLQLLHYGYKLSVFSRIDELARAFDSALPLALVVDCSLSGVDEEVTHWLQQQVAGSGDFRTPMLFIAPETDFKSRMQAVNAGSVAYFTPPLDVTELFERLVSINQLQEEMPYDVLIVDDDVDLAQHYSLLLTHAGMRTQVVNRPEEVLDKLADFRPDVVLMDLYMPEYTGFEVASLIRQDKSYVGVPIVFLSSETRSDRQLYALGIGGDEFLTKPIADDYLVASVRYRARRARELDVVMSSDSLTGLLKHTRIKEELHKEARRSVRQNEALAFAMIDVDYFKKVNDTYGHQIGDRVLKSLSHLLRQRLRVSDAIGRYGGEEFAVVLPNTDREGAVAVLESLRESFAEIVHEADDKSFKVTVSIGVVICQGCSNSELLIEQADRALYRAKQNGRNQLVVEEVSQD